MKLNLGCGFNKLEGYLNVDKERRCNPDAVCDLENVPWTFYRCLPLQSNSVDEIVMRHVLEHLGQTPHGFIGIMKELHRVLRPGGQVKITVPHPRSDNFLSDPTHVRPITLSTLQMFSKEYCEGCQARGDATTPIAIYNDIDLKMVDKSMTINPRWARKMESLEGAALEAMRTEIGIAIDERWNVCFDLSMVLEKQ